MSFAAELKAAREEMRDRRDPEWCVLRVVAEEFGLTTDPLDERGVQGPWYLNPEASRMAARLLYLGLGLTKRAVGDRLGCSATATAVYNANRPPDLEDDELTLFERAMALNDVPAPAPRRGPISFRVVIP